MLDSLQNDSSRIPFPRVVALEGQIGVGKSTLCSKLEEAFPERCASYKVRLPPILCFAHFLAGANKRVLFEIVLRGSGMAQLDALSYPFRRSTALHFNGAC